MVKMKPKHGEDAQLASIQDCLPFSSVGFSEFTPRDSLLSSFAGDIRSNGGWDHSRPRARRTHSIPVLREHPSSPFLPDVPFPPGRHLTWINLHPRASCTRNETGVSVSRTPKSTRRTVLYREHPDKPNPTYICPPSSSQPMTTPPRDAPNDTPPHQSSPSSPSYLPIFHVMV